MNDRFKLVASFIYYLIDTFSFVAAIAADCVGFLNSVHRHKAKNMKSVGILTVALLFFTSALCERVVGEDAAGANRKIDANWLQKNIVGLGPSIPGDIVELQTRKKPLLQTGVSPELIEIGTMEADKWHFVVIKFVNMFDDPIRVADIASSCGCLVAGSTEQLIEPRSEGHVIAVMKPQQQPGVYRKSLTISFDNGLIWPVMISGIFASEFEFDQDSVKLDAQTQEVTLTLERKFGNRELSMLDLKAQSGYLMLRKTDRLGADQIRLTFSVPIETRRSPVAVSERVVVSDSASNDPICELIVGIDIPSGMQCRPRRVLLKRAGNYFSGTVYLLGNLEPYKHDLRCKVEMNVGIPVDVSIDSLGRTGAAVVVRIACGDVPLAREEVNEIHVFVNDRLVAGDLKFSFFEE